MKYLGLNPINTKGSKFETGYGYSKFIKLKADGKNYSPIISGIINTWGVKNHTDRIKKNVYGEIIDAKNSLNINVQCSGIDINGFIGGYPSIKLGESIWGPSNGFKLGRVRDYDKMLIDIKFGFQAKGFANFAYDIWLTKNEEGDYKKGDVEIMIWLDYNFDIPYKTIGETKDFIIKYCMKKSGEPGATGIHWIIFLAKNKTNSKKFDLRELIEYTTKKVKNIKNYYIRSIDLGIEFGKNTKANAKISKINYSLKKKKTLTI